MWATRIAAAAAAVLLTGTIANAADIARPVYKAPPAVAPAFSWTGCYIGGHVGYGWGSKSWADPTVLGATFADFDVDGAIAGGQVGCDYQYGPWVFGVEGQGSWSGIDGSGPFLLPGGSTAFTTNVDALWSITGRIGYAFDRSLFYVKGGWALADDKFQGTDAARGGALFVDFSDNRSGWTVGGGWEYAFAPGWSWKVEYMYMDFGTKTYNTNDILAGVPLPPVDIEQQIHTVKFGINYRFGAYGKEPVVAKY